MSAGKSASRKRLGHKAAVVGCCVTMSSSCGTYIGGQVGVSPLECHGATQVKNAPKRYKDNIAHRCCEGHCTPLSHGQTPGRRDVCIVLQLNERQRGARRLRAPTELSRHM